MLFNDTPPLVGPSLRTRPEHTQFGGQHPLNRRTSGRSGDPAPSSPGGGSRHPGFPKTALQILSKGFAEGKYFACFNRVIFTHHLAPLLTKTPFYF